MEDKKYRRSRYRYSESDTETFDITGDLKKQSIVNYEVNLSLYLVHVCEKGNLRAERFEFECYDYYNIISLEEATEILKQGKSVGLKVGKLHLIIKLFTIDDEKLLLVTNLRNTTLFYPELDIEKCIKTYFKGYTKEDILLCNIEENINLWLN